MGAYSGQSIGTAGLVSILALYFFSMGFSIVTPAMAKFAEAFPDQEYALINSLPTLFIGLAGLLFGAVAGRLVKYRTLALSGSMLSLLAGIGPAFIDDFYMILTCRALFGFGLGTLIPMANALVNSQFEGDRRTAMLSIGSLVFNAGGITLQLLGGCLADISWRMPFYAYALYAVAFVLFFFIPEPECVEEKIGYSFDRKVWIISALFAAYGMMQFMVMQNTAELFEIRNAGGASTSGLVLSLFTVAGCAGGIIFGIVKGKNSRAVFPLIWICSGLGLSIVIAFTEVVPMAAGMFVFGLGFGMIIPSFINWTGTICSAAALSAATATVTASMYFGDFLSVGWKLVLDTVFGECIISNLWALVSMSALMTVIFVMYNPFRSE